MPRKTGFKGKLPNKNKKANKLAKKTLPKSVRVKARSNEASIRNLTVTRTGSGQKLNKKKGITTNRKIHNSMSRLSTGLDVDPGFDSVRRTIAARSNKAGPKRK